MKLKLIAVEGELSDIDNYISLLPQGLQVVVLGNHPQAHRPAVHCLKLMEEWGTEPQSSVLCIRMYVAKIIFAYNNLIIGYGGAQILIYTFATRFKNPCMPPKLCSQ